MGQGNGWSDVEIAVYLRRLALLEKGMSRADAERLSEQMLMRDRPGSGDDRRICLECRHFRKSQCFVSGRPVACLSTILQRCDTFNRRGPAPLVGEA